MFVTEGLRPWLLVSGAPTEEFVTIARHAEAVGYTGIAIGDHVAMPIDQHSVHPSGANLFSPLSPFQDPLVSIMAMAAATTTLRFTTYSYVLPMREPFSVAKQVATAAMLSGYRVALGAGVGWLEEEIELLGYSPRGRGKRAAEMLTIIRDLWANGSTEFHGSHFSFKPVAMHPTPKQHIPIYVAGASHAALVRAAAHDGWLGPNADLDKQLQLLMELRQIREQLNVVDTAGEDFIAGRPDLSDESLQRLSTAGARNYVAVLWGFAEQWSEGARTEHMEAMTAFAGRLGHRAGPRAAQPVE
jgi:probable F420-dependent oxidoreductase